MAADLGRCTWKDCQEPATAPQHDAVGERWACLCGGHADELEAVLGCDAATFNPARLMRVWVLAQGGAGVAAKRVVGRG